LAVILRCLTSTLAMMFLQLHGEGGTALRKRKPGRGRLSRSGLIFRKGGKAAAF
jgi:hypothetical protein